MLMVIGLSFWVRVSYVLVRRLSALMMLGTLLTGLSGAIGHDQRV